MPLITTDATEVVRYKNLSFTIVGISAIRQSEKIELALTYGFRGMDLDLEDFHDTVTTTDIEHAQRLLESSNITLGYFHLPFHLNTPDQHFDRYINKLKDQVQSASAVDSKLCVAKILNYSTDRPRNNNMEMHRERLLRINEVLEPAGIKLALWFSASKSNKPEEGSAHEFLTGYADLQELVKSLGTPNVGYHVDTWDLFVSGGGKAVDVDSFGLDKLFSVALADAPTTAPEGGYADKQRLLPGKGGAVDCVATLRALCEKGYRGPITPAPGRPHFAGMTRDAIVRATGEAMDSVWRAIPLNSNGVVAPFAPEAESNGSAKKHEIDDIDIDMGDEGESDDSED